MVEDTVLPLHWHCSGKQLYSFPGAQGTHPEEERAVKKVRLEPAGFLNSACQTGIGDE